MRYLKVAALVSGTLLAPHLFAAEHATDAVSAFVHSEMQSQHIPGLTLLVSRNGASVRIEGYGVSDIELSVAARPKRSFSPDRWESSSLRPP